MTVAHIGLGVFVLAVTTVESFTVERDVAMGVNDKASLGAFEFRFQGVRAEEGPNYDGVVGSVVVTRDGAPVTVMSPAKRNYWVTRSDTTEAAIEMHGGSNVLVALGDSLGAGKWSIRFQVRPLVNFVWLGAGIMALGAGLAASDRRYRLARAQEAAVSAAAPGTAPAAELAP